MQITHFVCEEATVMEWAGSNSVVVSSRQKGFTEMLIKNLSSPISGVKLFRINFR